MLLDETADTTEPVPPVVDLKAPAVLLGTSGTTGSSKLVVWTSRTLATFADSAADRGLGSNEVFVLGLSMMHAGGSCAYASCLLTGAVMVLVSSFEADAALETIEQHRCTSFWASPSTCISLIQSQRARPRDVGSLRVCTAGSDSCSAELLKAFESSFGVPLSTLWAATEEMSATVSGTEPDAVVLLPDVDIRLLNAEGRPVSEGETGELLIRSPGTTPGYWLRSGQLDELSDGWFHTGDLMRRSSDGRLRFVARLKDLIVRGGSNVSPVEVEELLRRQPGIVDVAVAGLPDPELGQRIGAALVLATEASTSAAEEALAEARRSLADYKNPDVVILVDAIPRNALTKVDRAAVASQIAQTRGIPVKS